ncbi:MAG: Mfa1 fimbrilin C-terminal domain-containing protein [Bacteroidaceae bacterium]|nr:Mfa1 fimbrilin C-terminal domain-containing protein [Bacteroidaceae bacterium]
MKIKSLLIGMLTCSALVACTNDDLLENNELGNKEAMDAFVSVKLVMSDGVYSRATDDGGYVAGTSEESTINATNSIFLFYDVNGNWVNSGKLVTQTPATPEVKGDHEQANSYYGDAYIALSGPEGELAKSAQVLTVINYGANACEELKQLTLNEALKTITNKAISTEGDFLMTTSTYFETTAGTENDVNSDRLSNTTKITSDNICATQAAAKLAPVKIYVERASAKVEVEFESDPYDVTGSEDKVESDEANGAQGGDLVVDGNLQAVTISVKGVKLNNINEETYLTKRLLTNWATTAPFESWNIPENYRSYWAEGTKYSTTVWGDATNGSVLTSYSYSDATIASETPMYCYEQTVATPNVITNRSEAVQFPNVTTVLVAAEINVKNSDNTAYTGNLFQYGGVFYTEANYKNLLLKQIKDEGFVKAGATEGSFAELEAGDLSIVTDGTLAGIQIDVVDGTDGTYSKDVKENEDGTLTATASSATAIEAFLNGAAATETTEAIEGLDYVTETIGYAGRKCYYQIPIEHISSSAAAPRYGVVRNHLYRLTISGVKHIGEAVFNPTVKIPQIPEKSTEYYMAAELHVLSWHVVKQDVTLE